MQKRINISGLEPDAYKAMSGLEQYVRKTRLDPKLRELIKIRASQLNGCAYCIDMHTREALELGEDQHRLFAVAAWKESPLFADEERAVLQLTDEVTFIQKHGVSDDTYNNVLKYFDENQLAQIIMQIIMINSWNRFAISTNQVFKPKQ